MDVRCSYTELIDTDLLVEHPRNANTHNDQQIKLLAKIMKHQGWRNPIIVSKRSGFIVAGHGRLMAAKLNNWTECPIDKQDFETEADEIAHLVADNKIQELSETDMSIVLQNVLDLGPDFDFDLLGIPDFKLPEDFAPHCDEDEVPEHVEPKTKPGDLYQLGKHRLLCGDATNIQHVEELMGGEKADMVFTDPPYGMSAVSSSGVLSKNYKNDIMNDDTIEVAKDAFSLVQGLSIPKLVFWGANYYANVLPPQAAWLVWDKNNGQSDQMDCELAWTNLKGVTRQFTKASEKTNRVHPTQKPVALMEWCFERYGAGDILDVFGGSGSTLIACEKTKRKCFMMELDPHYTSIIIERWCKYTGKEAYLLNEDGTQTAWSDIKVVGK